MSKTARKVITDQTIGPSPGYQIGDADSKGIIDALDAAGFVIVPKDVTEAMIQAGQRTLMQPRVGGQLEPDREARHVAANCYRAMIAAAAQEPKP